jgi:hypothetical protein
MRNWKKTNNKRPTTRCSHFIPFIHLISSLFLYVSRFYFSLYFFCFSCSHRFFCFFSYFYASDFHFHGGELRVSAKLCTINEQAIVNKYPEGGVLALLPSDDIVESIGDRFEGPSAVSGRKGEKGIAGSSDANYRVVPQVVGEAATDFVPGYVPDIVTKRSSTEQPSNGIFG